MPSDYSSRLSHHRRLQEGAALGLVIALALSGLPRLGNTQTPKKSSAGPVSKGLGAAAAL